MSQPTTDHIGIQTTHIALGSNVTSRYGSPESTLLAALKRLEGDSLTLDKISRFFSTPAFPAGSGPDFVNAVAAARTSMRPIELLEHLHQVEAELGRSRTNRWEPRVIDLDLITYGALVAPDTETHHVWRDLPLAQQMERAPGELILPHPRLQDRAFVLGPMCDIAPDWVHPILKRTAKQLLDACPQADRDALRPLSDG